MSDFDTWMNQAWTDHATDAAAVARRLPEALALVNGEPQLLRLAHLSHHVHGEHLGQWQAGREALLALQSHPQAAPGGDAAQALVRYLAALALASGQAELPADASPSTRIRVLAMAAASLMPHDSTRATTLLQQALAEAEGSGLPDNDPSMRNLAITGNGMACGLEEKPGRSAAERELMILAAQTGRRFWQRAGTWLETERAEYRLSRSWCHAGDPTRARHHAQQCLEIVREHGNVPLEVFFGWEALGLAEAAAGNVTGHARAVEQAREAFATLEEGDRGWCQASLDQLAGTGAATPS